MQLLPTYPVSTARLRLRPLVPADVEALLAYRGQEEVCRYLPFPAMTRAVLEERLAGDFARTTITDEGQRLTLGVVEAATERLVGDVVLMFHSREHRDGELGYVFHPDVRGRGYAAEASAAMLRLGFEDLGLHRVVARLDARNTASARLAVRLGLRQEAHLVSNAWFKGGWSDELVFALLAQEWRASPAAALVGGPDRSAGG